MKKPLLHKQGFLKVYQAPIPIHFCCLLPDAQLPAQSYHQTYAKAGLYGDAKILMFQAQSQNLQPN
ncbi:hypothetical protein [Pedobacter soli]|uniref:hypothetical protein n=1 Tax=Pedobacter soli TaxID=390242 RepID=UPI00115FAE16|nr:hypothetical protein [Pedobacter soli]